jgi:glycosyltransferase involved in cell wall biosynthesis
VNLLAIATTATATPMGAQVYETEVASRAADALAATGQLWRVDPVIVRSLRATLEGTIRLPIGVLERSGRRTRRSIGRLAYPKGALVHRMNLTLPPAAREVVTLHDTVAWRFPDEGKPIASSRDELRAAAAVVCVSENTAADAVEMFGIDNPRVVHLGVDARFRNAVPLDRATRRMLSLEGPYILHAGGSTLRKNLDALAAAWSRVASAYPNVTLALSGPVHERRTRLFGGMPQTVLLGRVDRSLVPGLIAGAEAVVVPSLYEGFGLPVLEAMAAGTPVVAAATSSIPEVAGNAAILVEPSAAGIADGIFAVLDAATDRTGMIAQGRARASEFTWERCAAEHAAVWNDVGL